MHHDKGVAVELELSNQTYGDTCVVHVTGEIDLATAPALRRYLDEQIAKGCRELVVDIEGVTLLDSTGLGVLVGRRKVMRANGNEMRVVGARDRVLKVLVITGLDRVFEVSAVH